LSLACKSTVGAEAEEGEGKGRRVAAGQPPPRASPLCAVVGPHASSSCKREDEVGEGSPLASHHLTPKLRKKGRRLDPNLHAAASHHLACRPSAPPAIIPTTASCTTGPHLLYWPCRREGEERGKGRRREKEKGVGSYSTR
jgi:hypothetical protein